MKTKNYLTLICILVFCASSRLSGQTCTVTSSTGGFCPGASLTVQNPSGCAGNKTYSWTGPTCTPPCTTQTIADITAGIYSVTVFDGNSMPCCTASIPINNFTVTVSGAGPSGSPSSNICPNSFLILTATPSTQIGGPYTYSWEKVGTPNTPAGTTNPITVSQPGTYIVTATNTCGFPQTATIMVTQTNESVTIAAAPICSTMVNSLTAIPLPPGSYTYLWSFNNQTGNPINVPAGTYNVTATHTSNSCTATSSITVGAVIQPTVTSITANPSSPFCASTQLTANTTPNPPPTGSAFSYSWVKSGNPNPIGTTNPITVNQPGTYIVTVTLQPGGCTATNSITVTQNPTPTWTSDPTPITACAGDQISISIPVTPSNATYTWVATNPTGIGSPSMGGPTPIGTPIMFQAANVTSTQVGGITITPTVGNCPAAPPSKTVSVTVNPRPSFTTPPPATVSPCGGTIVNIPFTLTTGSTFNYSSTGNIGLSPSSANGLPTNQGSGIITFTAPNSATNGSITITPVLGSCLGTPMTVQVTIKQTPVVTYTINPTPPPDGYCPGQQITITFTVTPAATPTWSNSNQNIGLPTTGSGNIIFTTQNGGLSQQDANITVTATLNGCISFPVTIITIKVKSKPSVNQVQGQFVRCQGEQIITGSFPFTSMPNGATFKWTTDGDNIGLPMMGTGQLPTFTASAPGIANIYVEATLQGCSSGTPSIPTFQITIKQKPVLNNVPDTALCEGGHVVIHFQGNDPGIDPVWSAPSGGGIGMPTNGHGDIDFFPSNIPDNQNVPVTVNVHPELGGCIGDGQNFIITVNFIPTATINFNETNKPGASNSDGLICAGGTLVLSPTNINYQCNWSSSDPLLTVPSNCQWIVSDISQNTDFSVTVTNPATGCAGFDGPRTVNVVPDPNLSFQIVDPCVGLNLNLVPLPATFDEYIWSRAFTFAQLQNGGALLATTPTYVLPNVQKSDSAYYILRVKDSFKCEWSYFETVRINEIPHPEIDETYKEVCKNQQVFYRVTNPEDRAQGSFDWEILPSFSDTFQLNDVLWVHWGDNSPDSYKIKVTETLGSGGNSQCKGTDEINVHISDLIAPDTFPIYLSPVNNIMFSGDPNASCYQWGYYNPSIGIGDDDIMKEIAGEEYQAYAPGTTNNPPYNKDYTYWVKTWNGDCTKCETISFHTIERDTLVQPPPTKERKFVLYPNPNDGSFRLEVTQLPASQYTLMLVDAWGRTLERRVVATPNGELNEAFFLDEVASGFYTAVLMDKKGVYRSRKFLINR